MELREYCDSMAAELTAWRTKTHDVVTKFDRMDTGDKSKVVPQINDLHMIIEELDDSIKRLKTECSTEWNREMVDLEGKFALFYEEMGRNVG